MQCLRAVMLSWATCKSPRFSSLCRIHGGLHVKGLEEELFLDLRNFTTHGQYEQFISHVHQESIIAGSMFTKGVLNWGIHKTRIADLCQQVGKAVAQLLGCGRFQAQTRVDVTGDGQQIGMMEAVSQTAVSGQDNEEDGAGVQMGAGEQEEFREYRGIHLLGFIVDQDGVVERGLDLGLPFFRSALAPVQRLWGLRATPKR